MNKQDALDYLKDLVVEGQSGDYYEDHKLAELIVWAYDKGWTEGREDYVEDHNPTDESEWERTR